ncbi:MULTISPECIES: type II toxin-antitoxin system RelE/ParE family toxin [Cryobacterium]|uniref:Type II toxin-antitoxin system RelE/ParE family toxin n=1 Tax=Cryobacterium levicorallinum TaxID=995038 RepID=A0A1I2ZHF6_9MICO|nr:MULTISPECIES: type II toxin-antitoxin system RelE/ParE family toxin [Cryobacterium]TFB89480.1 type II toxin-antitoxin system RelE/ParE family toxin [Cryobacterium levicorallinum]TFD56680.1 type II toxin-antitoxin system RelE/ParE family toxin [Cryobacterium sp. Hh38]GEP25805.1 translation repressor RelE [Cryobacterium levicorallinum]SFH37243.1 mRNA interferase RelE/StbE [Cryobacterium levicorallinum]
MSYTIRFTPKAAKQVRKLDSAAAKRIRDFLEQRLSVLDNPRQLGKKLVNEEFWRYRVGDYRILTNIDDDQILILIVEVAHRREVYNRL